MIDYVTHSDNSTKTMAYLGKQEAHSQRYTKTRNLVVGSQNLALDYQNNFNWVYSAMQMRATRELAGKADKKIQAHHLIISFSDTDFPKTDDEKTLQTQAQQAYTLVYGFLKEKLKTSSQFALTVQRDGNGGYLHTHCCINSVNVDGTTFNTNFFDKEKLDKSLNDYFVKNFQKVTGREFTPVVAQNEHSNGDYWNKQHKDDENHYVWKDDLRDRVEKAASISLNFAEFNKFLGQKGVTTKLSRTKKTFTYIFTDEQGVERHIRAYRMRKGKATGLGKEFTREQLQARFEQNKADQIDLPTPKPTKQSTEQRTEPVVHIVQVVQPQKTVIPQPVKTEQKRKKRRKRKTVSPVNRELNSDEKIVKSPSRDRSLQEQFYQNPNNYENTKQQENDHPYLP